MSSENGQNSVGSGVYQFAEFRLEAENLLLFRNSEVVPLAPKAVEVLLALVTANGRVVAKREILDQVWTNVFVEETNLTHHISDLRKALGEEKNGRRFIETIPRRGYRFVAPVVELPGDELTEIIADERMTTRIVEQIEFITDDDDENEERRFEAEILLRPPPKQIAAPPMPQTSNRRGWIFGASLLALAAFSAVGFIFYKSDSREKNEERKIPAALPEITRVSDTNVSISVISPDGKFVAYAQNSNVVGGGSLFVRQLDTNREIRLVEPDGGRTFADMKFSPDGALVYFISYEKDAKTGAIYRIPFLGGVKQKVADLDEDTFSFAVAPDGKQIAFYRRSIDGESGSLVAAPLDNAGEKERVLLSFKFAENNFGGFLSWSPDGRFIAFTRYATASAPETKIFGFDLQSSELKSFSEEAFEDIGKNVFTPDGRDIIFVGKRRNTAQNFFALNIQEGSLRILPLENTDGRFYSNYGLSITADGKTLTADVTETRADICRIEVSDTNASDDWQRLKRGTADGRRGLAVLPGKILFTALANGKSDIWKMNEDGSDAQPLTSDAFVERHLIAARDGRTIVYSSNAAGGWHLFRTNAADASETKQLTFGESVNIQPDISPDGNWVVYISEENGKSIVKKIPLGGGEPVLLNDEENSVYPKFSPDGNRIAFQILSPARSQPGAIALMSASGGKVEKTYAVAEFQFRDSAHPIQWMPDGAGIIFSKATIYVPSLWRLDLQTGIAAPMLTSPPDETIYRFVFSPNGSRLFLSRGIYQSNTVLIRNFSNSDGEAR